MEPEIPDWITVDFLKQSLQSDIRYKDIAITDFTASLAAPPGNNYGSLVIRVAIDCELKGCEQKLSLIVKGPVMQGAIRELLKDMKNSEPLFYNVFLPEAKKLMEYQIAPDTYHSPIPSVIVMEDLKETGFVMADRIKQLDFEHCLLHMEAAAAFHATPAVLYKQNPEIINCVCGENFYQAESKGRLLIENMYRWALECMANHIPDKEISQTISDSSKYICGMLEEIHRPNDCLNSLLQVDPWTTNMMFKYDGRGNVCDIKLLDFQNMLLGSPVHDIVFFIWFSANDEVRTYRLKDLYSHYFTRLNVNLKTLSCQEIDFDYFTDTIKMFSPLALITAATSAFVLNQGPADFNEIIAKGMGPNAAAEANPFERYYTDDFCQNRLPHMVNHLAAEGVFDYLATKLKAMAGGSS